MKWFSKSENFTGVVHVKIIEIGRQIYYAGLMVHLKFSKPKHESNVSAKCGYIEFDAKQI